MIIYRVLINPYFILRHKKYAALLCVYQIFIIRHDFGQNIKHVLSNHDMNDSQCLPSTSLIIHLKKEWEVLGEI